MQHWKKLFKTVFFHQRIITVSKVQSPKWRVIYLTAKALIIFVVFNFQLYILFRSTQVALSHLVILWISVRLVTHHFPGFILPHIGYKWI